MYENQSVVDTYRIAILASLFDCRRFSISPLSHSYLLTEYKALREKVEKFLVFVVYVIVFHSTDVQWNLVEAVPAPEVHNADLPRQLAGVYFQ